MRQWLAPAHLALTLVIIVWNVVLAGRIAQLRQATRPFAAVTGMAGLLLIPAFIVAVATTTVITGRAISSIDWIWPVVVTLFAIQSVYALSRRLVHPLWGYPIAFYDVLLAVASLTRFFAAHGYAVPRALLIPMAAQIDALALVTTEAAITSPFFLHVPLISPAFPALRRLTAGFRLAMAALAFAWFGVIVAELPRADVALNTYRQLADERLRERPDGFTVGLKVFPDVAQPPSAAAVRADLRVAEFVGALAVNVIFAPGALDSAIDSVSRAIDLMPRDSMVIIATIGYHGKLLPGLGTADLEEERRLNTIRRVLRRLRPDVVVPAQDPYGAGARYVGRLPVERWQAYYTRAAALVREVRPRTRIALAASSFDVRDSTLYAWASAPGSPVDLVGFSFYPTRLGGKSLDAGFRAADRWMRALPPRKPHWVLGIGGYPLAHGERSQDQAIWGALTWATAHVAIRGLIVTEASDYGQSMGLRAPNGHWRLAAATLKRAIKALRESAVQRQPPLAAVR